MHTLNRQQRRLMQRTREARPARRTGPDRMNMRLALMPWRIDATWHPLDRIIAQIELHGTVETINGVPCYHDDRDGTWYDAPAAIEGLADFHHIAATRKGWTLDLTPLRKLVAKLRLDSPIFQADIDAVRQCEAVCRRHAAHLTVREAADIIQTVRISVAMERAA